MRIILRSTVFTLLVSFVLSSGAYAAKLSENVRDILTPHKALYEIKMVSRKNSSQVLNISGQMFFEWTPSCEAWTTDHRFNLLYEYADSAPIHITSDFTTYEAFNGSSFDFNSRRKRNGDLYQEIRGRATLPHNTPQGTFGEAAYTMPEKLLYELKQDTLFPMMHTVELLKHARQGKKFYSATVFDGSDEDGPVEINSFIGNKISAKDTVDLKSGIDETLIDASAWKVRMAFFPLINPSAEADYEMSVTFHENGIISDMLVEYTDFSVTQKLVALEKLEENDCKN